MGVLHKKPLNVLGLDETPKVDMDGVGGRQDRRLGRIQRRNGHSGIRGNPGDRGAPEAKWQPFA